MRALLGNLTILDHQNSIRASNRGQAMRDDERSSTLHQCFHAALDKRLGQRIHTGGSLAHNEQFRSGQYRSLEADQLFLSDRQQISALADVLLVPFLERYNEIMSPGDL